MLPYHPVVNRPGAQALADSIGVSQQLVSRARFVYENAPFWVEAVIAGGPLNQAHAEAQKIVEQKKLADENERTREEREAKAEKARQKRIADLTESLTSQFSTIDSQPLSQESNV
jgi:hypothetical protein